MIKKTAILLVFAVGLFVNCSDNNITQPIVERHGWTVQHPLLGNNDFYSVEFINEQIGWIGGSSGSVLHTTDGGSSWQKQKTEVPDFLSSSTFISEDTGWFASSYGSLIHTTDGGENWELQYYEDNLQITDLSFIDDTHGWFCGLGKINDTSSWVGVLLSTNDGGETWSDVIRSPDTVGQRINGLFFLDSLRGWITGQYVNGTMYTGDGCKSWELRYPLSGSVSDIHFFNDSIGYSYATVGSVLKTTNGGHSWTFLSIDNSGAWYYGMDFLNEQTGWVCGNNGFVSHTSDGGNTWENQFTDVGNRLNDIEFTSPSNGWAVGFGGTILHSTDGGDSWEYKNGTQALLAELKMFDKNNGCSVGQRGMIIQTNNGGRDWNILDPETNVNLLTIATPSINNWFAGGDSGALLKSQNQGRDWTTVSLNTNQSIKEIQFINENIGWITAGNVLYSTKNGGTNWQKDSLEFLTNESIYSIYFLNDTLGWITTSNYKMYKTINSGLSWFGIFEFPYPIYDINFLNDLHGFTVGYSLSLYETTDGGETWEWIYLDDGLNHFNSIEFVDSQNGWIVGGNNGGYKGIIYKTSDGGETWDLITKDVRNTLHGIDFIDKYNGWICGDNGTILHTTNGGLDY